MRGLWWILKFWSLHLKYPISWLAQAQSENCVGLCVIEFFILYNLDYGCITLRYDQLVIHPWPCLCPCSCYHAWFSMNVRCWGSLTSIYLNHPSTGRAWDHCPNNWPPERPLKATTIIDHCNWPLSISISLSQGGLEITGLGSSSNYGRGNGSHKLRASHLWPKTIWQPSSRDPIFLTRNADIYRFVK